MINNAVLVKYKGGVKGGVHRSKISTDYDTIEIKTPNGVMEITSTEAGFVKITAKDGMAVVFPVAGNVVVVGCASGATKE